MFGLLKCTFLYFCLFVEINCFESSNEWQSVIDSNLALPKGAKSNYVAQPRAEEISNKYSDERCLNDVQNFYVGINQSVEWAVKMYDSWGNAPSGILSGNEYNLGSFDGCVEVEMSTQYCLLQIEISNGNSSDTFNNRALTVKPEILRFVHPIKMLVGTCYPSTCSPDQTATLYQTFLNLHDLNVQVNPSGVKCYINDRDNGLEFSPMQIFAIIVFSVISLLIVSSTLADFCVDIKETNVVIKVWKAFSVYKNFPSLCDTQANSNDNEVKFACFDGLRVISMIWIAYGHSVLNTHRSPLINTVDIIPWSEKLWSIMSWSTFVFAMDTSFVIGGFLATISIKSLLERDQRPYIKKFLSIPRMWLHRYIRLAPAVIAALLFFPIIAIKLGKGPFWNSTMQELELCYDNWWSTLLFIQNFASPGKMCLGHLWYLAIDLQMFIVTTILLFLIHWKGLKFLWIAVILALGNIFNNMYWYFTKDYQWVYGKEPNTVERDALTYYRFRVTSWVIGVAVAIIYTKYFKKREQFKISSKLLLIGYVYCVVAVGVIVFNLSYMTNSHVTPSSVHNALFDSFSRLLWASTIALIIFFCISKNGGLLNRVLSSTIWRPLAKLSFCIYVLNYDIQLLKLGRNRTTVYMDNVTLVDRFWSDFGMSVTAAIFWTLAFEMPFRIIERIKRKANNLPITTNESGGNQGTALTN